MNQASGPPPFRLSQGIYQRLLRVYPARHRAEYGAAMAQLFRDQCRDAWQTSRHWGLAGLWLRTLSDLACTSILERMAALKERKTMTDKLASLFAFRVAPISTFLRVFILVFLLVFSGSIIVTYLLPESYASTARIKVEMIEHNTVGSPPADAPYDPYFIQTTFEIMQSEIVLRPVIEQLKLNEKWGKKYFARESLKTAETIELLRRFIQLVPVKNTQLIAITVYSDDKVEAAQIANAIAESYRDYRRESSSARERETWAGLERQSAAEQDRILTAQANVDSLKKKFNILESSDGAEATAENLESSVRKMSAQLEQLRQLPRAQMRQTLPSVINDGALTELLGKLNEAEQKYVQETNDYALSSVEVTRVASLIGTLNRQIDDRANGILAGMEVQLDSTRAAADNLAKQILQSKPNLETLPYWTAKQELGEAMEAHKLVLAKIESEKLAAQMARPAPVEIVETAQPGFAPVRPNKPLNIVAGAVLGIFLGMGAGSIFGLMSLLAGKRPGRMAVAA
jgi:uncharacterized protein involved in exopolysaccharide biosynthesis